MKFQGSVPQSAPRLQMNIACVPTVEGDRPISCLHLLFWNQGLVVCQGPVVDIRPQQFFNSVKETVHVTSPNE